VAECKLLRRAGLHYYFEAIGIEYNKDGEDARGFHDVNVGDVCGPVIGSR